MTSRLTADLNRTTNKYETAFIKNIFKIFVYSYVLYFVRHVNLESDDYTTRHK